MSLDSLVLIVPGKADVERDAVAEAWTDAGGTVERLDRFWDLPAHLDRRKVRLYGNDTFCLVVAQKLELELVSPDDRVLARAPEVLLKRRVTVERLAGVDRATFPAFVKPVIPKQFRAAVYGSPTELDQECRQRLLPSTRRIAPRGSDIVVSRSRSPSRSSTRP